MKDRIREALILLVSTLGVGGGFDVGGWGFVRGDGVSVSIDQVERVRIYSIGVAKRKSGIFPGVQ